MMSTDISSVLPSKALTNSACISGLLTLVRVFCNKDNEVLVRNNGWSKTKNT